MKFNKENLKGKRIQLIEMGVDPISGKPDKYPIPNGTEGTIYNVGGGVINVKWDNGRDLGVIDGIDTFIIL